MAPKKPSGQTTSSDKRAYRHRKPTEPPPDWPVDLTYLTDQIYSAAITADMQRHLAATPSDTHPLARIPPHALRTPCPRAQPRRIPAATAAHPARGQRGLFATQPLAPDTFVCLYLGRVHTGAPDDTDAHSDYDVGFDAGGGLAIDAARAGNEARFANDFRGVAARPNAEFRDCVVPGKGEGAGVWWERRLGVFVLSAGKAGKRKAGIAQGQEILVSYGKGFWEARGMGGVSVDTGSEG